MTVFPRTAPRASDCGVCTRRIGKTASGPKSGLILPAVPFRNDSPPRVADICTRTAQDDDQKMRTQSGELASTLGEERGDPVHTSGEGQIGHEEPTVPEKRLRRGVTRINSVMLYEIEGTSGSRVCTTSHCKADRQSRSGRRVQSLRGRDCSRKNAHGHCVPRSLWSRTPYGRPRMRRPGIEPDGETVAHVRSRCVSSPSIPGCSDTTLTFVRVGSVLAGV